jgi:hypothetical protein
MKQTSQPAFPPLTVEEIEKHEIAQEYFQLPEGETKKIYEIKEHKHYVLLHKKDDKPLKIVHAQNVLALMLKHS